MELIKLTLDNYNIEFKSNKKLSKKQIYGLKNVLQRDGIGIANTYLNTFKGKPQRIETYIEKDHSIDLLMRRESNYFLKMSNNMYTTFADHRPLLFNIGNWIGVEIECIIPKCSFDSCCDDPDCENDYDNLESSIQKDLRDQKVKFVSLKTDGSLRCSGDEIAIEMSVLTRVNDMSNLEKALNVLNSYDAFVNDSCGLHIHLDCRDVNNKNALRRAKSIGCCLPLFEQLQPESRVNNDYCTWRVGGYNEGSRYYAVNTDAIKKFNTIEVRLHTASTNFNKIKNWIDILFKISRAEITEYISDVFQLSKRILLTDSNIDYLKTRLNNYGNLEETSVAISLSFIDGIEYIKSA